MFISQAHAADAANGALAAPFWQDTTFLVAIAFVLLFVFFGKKMYVAITTALDDRTKHIQKQINEAAQLREQAQMLLASYEKKQHEAIKEAEGIIQAAKNEAERLAVEAAEQLDRNLKRSEQLAKDRIAQAEAQAVAEIKGLAVDIAMEAAKRVLTNEIDAAKSDQLIDKAIKNIAGKLH
ncbi:MAG: F0F1 ATP synthase subunit B [Alphaproteobacteria bacterium]|nr:F0F1 ATP synthase subunit B [Alphaproteobacteria bacterium]